VKIEIGHSERALYIIDGLLLHHHGMKYSTMEWLNDIREQIVKVQNKDNFKDEWRVIETFPNYEISGGGIIRTRAAQSVVNPRLDAGGFDYNVRLIQNQFMYDIPVKDILEKTFPELEID
jgi:hypothetical protein